MSFPAVMPAVVADLGLSAAQAGWIGGIYFAGYAGGVPFLSTLTDRWGARSIYLNSCLIGVIGSIGFAFWSDTFWPAFGFRFLGGIALAGVHMPGLKLLTDLLGERAKLRGAGIYSSSYALGSAVSFLIAGSAESVAGWPAVFAVAAVGPALAGGLVLTLPRAPGEPITEAVRIEIRPLLRNRSLIAYVLGYAGNTWEVFSIRVWFVAYLSWIVSLPGNSLALPPLAIVSGIAAIAGVPASLFVSELALRWGRKKAIVTTCIVSVVVCLGLGGSAGGSVLLVLPLLAFLQVSSFADVGSLTAGAVDASESGRRGASLALFAFIGSLTGFAGPVAVGMALDEFGGLNSHEGWAAAFFVMALGSTAAAIAVRRAS
jgi:MFS family permease